jgi:hypothetical protein
MFSFPLKLIENITSSPCQYLPCSPVWPQWNATEASPLKNICRVRDTKRRTAHVPFKTGAQVEAGQIDKVTEKLKIINIKRAKFKN